MIVARQYLTCVTTPQKLNQWTAFNHKISVPTKMTSVID